MTQTELLYRALKEYRKLTLAHRESTLRRDAIKKADAENDRLTVTRMNCTIDEDWIEAIEAGLPFIGKAIDEERQFILSNGETEQIEKVKHVSKESVTHLARHSNYITRVEEDKDIVPDRLYTVERLNDYTVYENRFLYMLLCDLRDFVSLRYNKLLELTNTYIGALRLDKTVNFNKERLVFHLSLDEERKDDKYLLEHNPMKPVIDRIDLLQRSVYYYLRTPLMIEVAKADKLKPPITKTNVLRMDKNFKETVKLYEFLSAYRKDGYTIEREEREFAPFSDIIADELSETVILSSFLAYEHGLGMEDALAEEYEREEKRRRQEEEERNLERIKALKKRITDGGGGEEEYMLLLEQRNKFLEDDSAELRVRRAEVEKLNADVAALNEVIAGHHIEIEKLNERHGMELAEVGARMNELGRERDAERAEHRAAMRAAEDNFYKELTARDETHRAAMREKEEELGTCKKQLAETEDKRALADGRLNALRFEHGLTAPQDDFSSQEAFAELEHQYAAFQGFFRGQWRKARRRIRREMWKATISAILAQRKKKSAAAEDRAENAEDSADAAKQADATEQTETTEQVNTTDQVNATERTDVAEQADVPKESERSRDESDGNEE